MSFKVAEKVIILYNENTKVIGKAGIIKRIAWKKDKYANSDCYEVVILDGNYDSKNILCTSTELKKATKLDMVLK